MSFHKAVERVAAVSAPAPEAINLEQALRPLVNGLGARFNENYLSDYDAWLSSDPGLVQFAAKAVDSRFVGRRSEREMLCFTMKKVPCVSKTKSKSRFRNSCHRCYQNPLVSDVSFCSPGHQALARPLPSIMR